MFRTDCPDHNVPLLQSIFGADKDVLRLPKRLCFNEINSMFRVVGIALLRIKLELHDPLYQIRVSGTKFVIATRNHQHARRVCSPSIE